MNGDLEHRLKNVRLIEPSDQLKERLTSAAMSAWHQPSTDVAWWIPIRRLGIALAAAIVIISFADYAGDRTTVRWQTADEVKVSEPTSDFDELGDATYSVFVRHVIDRPRQIDMAAIREYQEQVRRILDEQG